MHFSEIIKLQYGNKTPYIALYCFFEILLLKNARLPPIFFLDFNSLWQDLLFPHSHKPRKNTSVLVGTQKTERA